LMTLAQAEVALAAPDELAHNEPGAMPPAETTMPFEDQASFSAPALMEQALAAIEKAAYAEVQAAVAAADAAPWPQAAAAYTDVQSTGAGTWF